MNQDRGGVRWITDCRDIHLMVFRMLFLTKIFMLRRSFHLVAILPVPLILACCGQDVSRNETNRPIENAKHTESSGIRNPNFVRTESFETTGDEYDVQQFDLDTWKDRWHLLVSDSQSDTERAQNLLQHIVNLVDHDPFLSWEYINEHFPKEYSRKLGAARSYALERMVLVNPTKTADLLAGLEGGARAQGYQSSMRALAESRPREAAELINTIPPGQIREQMFNAFAAMWAEDDFAATLEWIDAIESSRDRDSAIDGMINGLALRDDGKFRDYYSALEGDRRLQLKLVTAHVSNLAVSGRFDQALDLTKNLPDQNARIEGYRSLALGTRDPESAGLFGLISSDTEFQDTNVVEHSIFRAVEHSPRGVADWIDSLEPDQSVSALASSVLVRAWFPYDEKAVIDWVGSLEETRSKDAAVKILAHLRKPK